MQVLTNIDLNLILADNVNEINASFEKGLGAVDISL
jgi:hypothetical protein